MEECDTFAGRRALRLIPWPDFNSAVLLRSSFRRPIGLVLVAIAALEMGAFSGCAGTYGHPSDIGPLGEILGLDTRCGHGCGCGKCCTTSCEMADCGGVTSPGGYCSEGGCEPDCTCEVDACAGTGCHLGDGSHDGHPHALGKLKEVACLPRNAFAYTANCCTPNAYSGPPNVPPPGRFHPVPTRPVFSPRFSPTPYGQAEYP